MQVTWNAVFYDSMVEYLSSWRKGKLWYGQPNVLASASGSIDHGMETENIKATAVSKVYVKFYLCKQYVMILNLMLYGFIALL